MFNNNLPIGLKYDIYPELFDKHLYNLMIDFDIATGARIGYDAMYAICAKEARERALHEMIKMGISR